MKANFPMKTVEVSDVSEIIVIIILSIIHLKYTLIFFPTTLHQLIVEKVYVCFKYQIK